MMKNFKFFFSLLVLDCILLYKIWFLPKIIAKCNYKDFVDISMTHFKPKVIAEHECFNIESKK